MQVKIQNLGAVKSAEIELKPLTVFVGENSTGKTWAAYALSSIFNPNLLKLYTQALINVKIDNPFSRLDNIIDSVLSEQSFKINIVDFARENLGQYLNALSRFSTNHFGTVFDTLECKFNNTQCDLHISKHEFNDVIKTLEFAHAGGSILLSRQKQSGFFFRKDQGDKFAYFYSQYEGDILDKIPETFVREFIVNSILSVIHTILFRDTHVLPTERSYFTALFQISSEILDVEASEPVNRKNSFWMINPIANFVASLRTFTKEQQIERLNIIQEVSELKKITDFADFLENEVLLGSISIDEARPSESLIFEFGEQERVELKSASSMIKELSSLVIFLRFFAKPDDLIIIDEPEMNLHPAAQVEIAEFLAMLVNSGLKLIITTHSPYIVDHLSNLMVGYGREDKAELTKKLYLEREEAFISPEDVSVYLFEDGTARSILQDDGTIEWSTFSNVSDDIANFL